MSALKLGIDISGFDLQRVGVVLSVRDSDTRPVSTSQPLNMSLIEFNALLKALDAKKSAIEVSTRQMQGFEPVAPDFMPGLGNANVFDTKEQHVADTQEADASDDQAKMKEAEKAEVSEAEAEIVEAQNVEAETANDEVAVAKKTETKTTKAEEAKAKKAVAKKAKAEEAEAKAAEAKAAEVKAAEAKKAKAEEAEAKAIEAKAVEAMEAEAKKAKAEEAEAKAIEAKAIEAMEAEAKAAEAEEAEATAVEAKAIEAMEAEAKKAEAENAALDALAEESVDVEFVAKSSPAVESEDDDGNREADELSDDDNSVAWATENFAEEVVDASIETGDSDWEVEDEDEDEFSEWEVEEDDDASIAAAPAPEQKTSFKSDPEMIANYEAVSKDRDTKEAGNGENVGFFGGLRRSLGFNNGPDAPQAKTVAKASDADRNVAVRDIVRKHIEGRSWE